MIAAAQRSQNSSKSRRHREPANPLSELWQRYIDQPSLELRNQLATAYLPAVRRAAHRQAERMHGVVDVDELVSDGMLALLQAIPRFDPEVGVNPWTYLLRRVVGAMLDGLRDRDPLSKSHRQQIKQIQALRQQLGREPDPDETQHATGSRHVRPIAFRSLDAPLQHPHSGRSSCWSEMLAEDPPTPYIDQIDAVNELLRGLGDRDRTLMYCYYLEHLGQRGTGQVLGLCESRVSQLHTQILNRLRHRMLSTADCRRAQMLPQSFQETTDACT
ncbi:MAG: sigma-70 family RNA polymerase sigma factor [bacterium]|nr:sigma-70 family RNA polymerase sigma factor [bacterium]